MRDLGITFDQFLNFGDYITAICRSTYFHIRNIGNILNLLSYNACSTIIHALIRTAKTSEPMRAHLVVCMTCSLLLLVEDVRGDHMEEAYSRAGLMTVL